MKVLLTKDVYKLGRAGDVKRVADGFGRNYLLPQGMAVLATPGALKQTESIRSKAVAERTELNKEMGGLAEKLNGVYVTFGTKAGETGKLYGSITTAMIAEELNKKVGASIDRHQIETQPIRILGEFNVQVRLTVDLIPEIKVIVHREGEKVALPEAEKEAPVAQAEKEAPVAQAEQEAPEAQAEPEVPEVVDSAEETAEA